MGLIWSAVLAALAVLAAILSQVVARLVSDDFKEWLPWITRCLIERAVSRLPESERGRLHEEWSSNVNEWPGAIAKVWVAFGYLHAAKSIGNIVQLSENPRAVPRIKKAAQRVSDIMGVIAFLVLAGPIMCCAALVIKLDSSGPVLVRYKYVGRNGQPRNYYAFRTCVDFVDLSLPPKTSPRVTRVGSFLRLTRIEMFPGVLSVFLDRMSV